MFSKSNRYRISVLILNIALLLSLVQSEFLPRAIADEAIYYVAPDGNNANSGTVDKPFQTIQHAVNQLKPGDTLFVRAGIYKEIVHIQNSGVAGLPITVAAYPGEQVMIDGEYTLPPVPSSGWIRCNARVSPPQCFHFGALVRISGSYVTFDGFEITHSLGRGLVVSPAKSGRPSNITVKNNNIHDNRSAGTLISEADKVTFENNDVWHSGDYAMYDRSGDELGWPVAVSGRDAHDIIYRRNRIFNNWTEGLDTGSDSANIWVEDNEIFDNFALQLYTNRSEHVIVQRNLIYCTNDPNFYRGGRISPGIAINNEITSSSLVLVNNVQVLNNIVAGCDHNFGIWGGQGTPKHSVSNILIANNLFINGIANQTQPPNTEFYIVDAAHTQIVVKENIFLLAGQTSVAVPTNPEIVFDRNWWLRQPTQNVTSPRDFVGDPGLVNPYGFLNPGQVDVNAFKLRTTAAAANKKVGPTEYVADDRGPQREPNVPGPTPQDTTITISHDAQPNSGTNFSFTGALGTFKLDDPTKNDGDAYTNQQTVQVPPGVYTVSEKVPSGWHLTIACNPASSGTVNTAGNSVSISTGNGDTITCTFTNQKAATIRARVYNDRNGNRTRQGSEPWLAKWTINLYDAQSTLVGAQLTNNQGKVSFTNVRPGAYSVCEGLTSGWFNTQPGATHTVYQQPCYTVTVAPNQTIQVTFGNNQTGATRALSADNDDGGILFFSVDDTDDEESENENVMIDAEDEWLTVPDFEQQIFLPLITR